MNNNREVVYFDIVFCTFGCTMHIYCCYIYLIEKQKKKQKKTFWGHSIQEIILGSHQKYIFMF